MPSSWTRSALRHVVRRWYSGGTPDTDVPEFWADADDGIAWVSIADITRCDEIRETDRALSPQGLSAKGLDVMPPGTLLISMYASIGKVATLAIPAAANQAILGMEFAQSTLPRFISYWLQHVEGNLTLFSSSNTQDNLNAAKVRAIPVFVPSIAEQRVIAAFLDRETAKIDALVAEQRRLMDLLREKRQAVISHAVTKGLNPGAPLKHSGVEWLGEVPAHWEVTPLKRVSPQITVGIVVEPSKYYVDKGVPALRSLNVSTGAVSLENLVFISEASNQLHGKSILREGDLVAVRSGQPGTTAVIPPELDGCNCIDLIIIRKPIIGTERFLCYYLGSDAAKMQFETGAGGAIQQHFNVGTAMGLLVAVPPAAEQDEIVDYLDRVTRSLDALERDCVRGIALLQERRAALITAAVTGKIDVRGVVVEQAA
jgi:type I restriction enzyme S subunit